MVRFEMMTKNRILAALVHVLVPAAVLAAAPARAQDSAPADSARVYKLSEVDVMPEMVNRSEVAGLTHRYHPREMRRRRESGTATVRFVILPGGGVDSARIVVENATNEEFGAGGVNVIRWARFAPARKDGRPVAVWATLPLLFWLEPRSAPASRAPGDARPPRR